MKEAFYLKKVEKNYVEATAFAKNASEAHKANVAKRISEKALDWKKH